MATQNNMNFTSGTTGQVLSEITGSPPAFQTNSTAMNFLTASVVLTSSQVKSLVGTPIQIIPAPGAGKAIFCFDSSIKMTYGGTTAFVCVSASLNLAYTNGSGQTILLNFLTDISQTVNSTWINQARDFANITTANIENAKVVFYNGGTNITGDVANDSTLTVSVNYVIVQI